MSFRKISYVSQDDLLEYLNSILIDAVNYPLPEDKGEYTKGYMTAVQDMIDEIICG